MQDKQIIIIQAGKTEKQYFKDLWNYRELFYFLAWRDIIVRYKQTVIGVLWSVIRPFLTMVVFTFIFGNIAKMPSDGVPYPILVYVAMLPWQFFSTILSESSNSLISNSNMISKIYFPRLVIPTSTVIVSLVDLLISLVILVGLMIFYGFVPSIKIVLMPVFIMIAALAAIGSGLWFSSLNVKYRDFRYIVPFVVQFGLYISPVGFSSKIIPDKWIMLYSLNPMVGVIDGFRWSVLGQGYTIYLPGVIISFIFIMVILVTGLKYFRKTEKIFADII